MYKRQLVYDSDTYIGSANLITIEPIQESQSVEADGTSFVLNGVSSSLVSVALSEEYQGRPIQALFGVLDTNGALISDPYITFAGKMDVMSIQDDGTTSKIVVTAENDLITLKESKERRYTPEDQKAEYSGDLGFDFVPLIQDIELTWGAGRKN